MKTRIRVFETAITSRWIEFYIMRSDLVYKDVKIEELEEALDMATLGVRLEFMDLLNRELVRIRRRECE